MIDRKLHTIDAEGISAGRLASRIAYLLQGKHKPGFLNHVDSGDKVMVQNVGKMKFTGKKMSQKLYHRYSGYPGGIITTQLQTLYNKNPQRLLRMMINNMLPKNRLRSNRLKRLSFEKQYDK